MFKMLGLEEGEGNLPWWSVRELKYTSSFLGLIIDSTNQSR